MKDGNLSAIEIEQRRQAGVKHGGEAAVKSIQHGEPLRGLAKQAEDDVYRELAENGVYGLTERNAARLQAACDLYWNAVQKAAEKGDLKALDGYIARFGWLASASLRAWAQVRAEQKQQPRQDVTASVIEVVKKHEQNNP